MRRFSAAVLAAALLIPAEAFAGDTNPIESWYRAQTPLPGPVQTRYDTLVVPRDKISVQSAVMRLNLSAFGEGMLSDGRGLSSDTLNFNCPWRAYYGIPALGGQGAANAFAAQPGHTPQSALELREGDKLPFDRIDYRLMVQVVGLTPKYATKNPKTRIVVSAQFIGFPRLDDIGIVTSDPGEIRSSGLIEHDYLDRLRKILYLDAKP